MHAGDSFNDRPLKMKEKSHLRLVVNVEELEPLPYGLVTQRCPICGRMVHLDEILSNETMISRIGGDSANGYEPVHYTCAGLAVRREPTADDNDDADWE